MAFNVMSYPWLHALIFFLGIWREILLANASLKEFQLASTELYSGLLLLKESLNIYTHILFNTVEASPMVYISTLNEHLVRYSA